VSGYELIERPSYVLKW